MSESISRTEWLNEWTRELPPWNQSAYADLSGFGPGPFYWTLPGQDRQRCFPAGWALLGAWFFDNNVLLTNPPGPHHRPVREDSFKGVDYAKHRAWNRLYRYSEEELLDRIGSTTCDLDPLARACLSLRRNVALADPDWFAGWRRAFTQRGAPLSFDTVNWRNAPLHNPSLWDWLGNRIWQAQSTDEPVEAEHGEVVYEQLRDQNLNLSVGAQLDSLRQAGTANAAVFEKAFMSYHRTFAESLDLYLAACQVSDEPPGRREIVAAINQAQGPFPDYVFRNSLAGVLHSVFVEPAHRLTRTIADGCAGPGHPPRLQDRQPATKKKRRLAGVSHSKRPLRRFVAARARSPQLLEATTPAGWERCGVFLLGADVPDEFSALIATRRASLRESPSALRVIQHLGFGATAIAFIAEQALLYPSQSPLSLRLRALHDSTPASAEPLVTPWAPDDE